MSSVVTIELVSDPPNVSPPGLSHMVVKVDSLNDVVAVLRASGATSADMPQPPDDRNNPQTVMITDPDGHHIELVQWPDGHADGMTSADWAGQDDRSGG